jgi:hypothetical protein
LLTYALIALVSPRATGDQGVTLTPPEYRRPTEQTFLTFPEWFLVHSPAEYAAFVKGHPPSEFPFLGHVRQFWTSYRKVAEATREYPLNTEYHVMIGVIGVSTTIEYGLRSAYETVVGRVTELAAGGRTSEEAFAARVAQDYVDFIRRRPWYEFDFASRLRGLWKDTSFFGKDPLRKWERKYALTTEYGAKAIYGWLLGSASQAAYGEAGSVTAVVLDRRPAALEAELPEFHALRTFDDGSVLATVPRYYDFRRYASALAARGVSFREIAGNRSVILVTALVPAGWAPREGKALFTQPLLTRPGRMRVALVVPVASLAKSLERFRKDGDEVEHVYDY